LESAFIKVKDVGYYFSICKIWILVIFLSLHGKFSIAIIPLTKRIIIIISFIFICFILVFLLLCYYSSAEIVFATLISSVYLNCPLMHSILHNFVSINKVMWCFTTDFFECFVIIRKLKYILINCCIKLPTSLFF